MKKSIAFIFLTALIFVQCDWYRNLPKVDYVDNKQTTSKKRINNVDRDAPPNNALPGECLTKCIMPDRYDIEEVQLAVFTGKEGLENIELEIREVEIEPEVIQTYNIVVDTTQTDNYEIVNIEVKKLIERGRSEWREAPCPTAATANLVYEVQDALKGYGYYQGSIDNVMDEQTKTALVEFQKEYGLPIGCLDLETLKALNIRY